jgi:hypothetical protein
MRTTRIDWEWRLDPMLEFFDGLPSFKATAALEQVFALAVADVESRVHVITGSLKASAKPESDFKDDEWKASITYGGASFGAINDPVRYAVYEMARGGSHDFFRTLPEYDLMFEQAINEGFDGAG